MKLLMLVEVDISSTMAETIQRNGCQVCPDGSAMQVKVPHSPSIPRRKTRVAFVEDPATDFDHMIKSLTTDQHLCEPSPGK